jgi:hypothetical protein
MKPFRTVNRRLELLKQKYSLHGEKPTIVTIHFPGEIQSYEYLNKREFIQLERLDEKKYKITVLPTGVNFINQFEKQIK